VHRTRFQGERPKHRPARRLIDRDLFHSKDVETDRLPLSWCPTAKLSDPLAVQPTPQDLADSFLWIVATGSMKKNPAIRQRTFYYETTLAQDMTGLLVSASTADTDFGAANRNCFLPGGSFPSLDHRYQRLFSSEPCRRAEENNSDCCAELQFLPVDAETSRPVCPEAQVGSDRYGLWRWRLLRSRSPTSTRRNTPYPEESEDWKIGITIVGRRDRPGKRRRAVRTSL